MLRRLLLACLAALPLPALANDSVAELGAGGLALSRNDVIIMEREDLYISPEKVTVDYVFRNTSDAPVDTIVAFPMPDISGNPYWMPSIPNDKDDNFLGFSVSIGGKPVKPELEHKAFAVGIDVTAELKAQGVPLFPFGDEAFAALEKLPDAVASDWRTRGLLVIDEYDDGSGWKQVRSPYWQLKSTYWWRASFPAGKPVKVSHRYTPSLGASAGLSFFYDGAFQGETYGDYKAKYCMDKGFENAVLKAAKQNSEGYPQLYENRLSYVLTTGGNWAGGTIGKFKLTVDKSDTKNIVSFCGTGVRKTGPTTFEMIADDYYPARDIDVLILVPFEIDREASREAPMGAPPPRQKLPYPNPVAGSGG